MFLSEWREFPWTPCVAGKNFMTDRVSILLKSLASLICFRACFFLVELRNYQHPGYTNRELWEVLAGYSLLGHPHDSDGANA